jgi:hypothetical protein
MVRLIVSGGDEVPDLQKVVAEKVLVCHHVGASTQGIGCRIVVHPVGELRLGSHALPRGRRRRLAGRCVAL